MRQGDENQSKFIAEKIKVPVCQPFWKLLLQPSLVPCLLPLIKQGKNFVYKVSQYFEFKAFFLGKDLSKARRNVENFFPKCFKFSRRTFQVIIIPVTLFFLSSFFPFFPRQGRK